MTRPLTPAYVNALTETASLWGRVFEGDRRATEDIKDILTGRRPVGLSEAITTSDLFVTTTGDVLHRDLLSQYAAVPTVWSEFATRRTVKDFKPYSFIDLLGGRAGLSRVPELNEYPARQLARAKSSITVNKFGDRFAISWEAIINDELGELQNLPGQLAVAAAEQEDLAATATLVSATGPNAALFSSTAYNRAEDGTGGASNLLAGNPALSEASLENALSAVSQRRDRNGKPVVVQAYVLVVPPALEVTARRIVGASEIIDTTGNRQIRRPNPMAGRVRVVVNYWIPTVDVSANVNTSWYLLPDPNTPRPAIVVAFLRGEETPDLRVKADTGQRAGGGQIGATEGSFDIDDIQYRVRHIVGSAPLEAMATASSNGSGS